jgi:hypothetical protein
VVTRDPTNIGQEYMQSLQVVRCYNDVNMTHKLIFKPFKT